MEESLKVKFFKRLHEFYKPDSKQFSNINYSTDASWKYSGVGCLLIRFLAKDEVSVPCAVCVCVCVCVCVFMCVFMFVCGMLHGQFKEKTVHTFVMCAHFADVYTHFIN